MVKEIMEFDLRGLNKFIKETELKNKDLPTNEEARYIILQPIFTSEGIIYPVVIE